MGRMEDFTEGKVMSMMTLNGTLAIEATGNAVRDDDAIAYVSPTVNGLHVGVAGYALTADSDAIDATDMAIFYDNGPLSVKIAGREAIEISVASACIFLVGVDCIMFAFDGSSTVRRDRWSASASVRVIPLVER
jgi:hypothetical protein